MWGRGRDGTHRFRRPARRTLVAMNLHVVWIAVRRIVKSPVAMASCGDECCAWSTCCTVSAGARGGRVGTAHRGESDDFGADVVGGHAARHWVSSARGSSRNARRVGWREPAKHDSPFLPADSVRPRCCALLRAQHLRKHRRYIRATPANLFLTTTESGVCTSRAEERSVGQLSGRRGEYRIDQKGCKQSRLPARPMQSTASRRRG